MEVEAALALQLSNLVVANEVRLAGLHLQQQPLSGRKTLLDQPVHAIHHHHGVLAEGELRVRRGRCNDHQSAQTWLEGEYGSVGLTSTFPANAHFITVVKVCS